MTMARTLDRIEEQLDNDTLSMKQLLSIAKYVTAAEEKLTQQLGLRNLPKEKQSEPPEPIPGQQS